MTLSDSDWVLHLIVLITITPSSSLTVRRTLEGINWKGVSAVLDPNPLLAP